MKHNFMTKMASALLAVVFSTAAFSVTAFASGGEETTGSVAEQKTADDVSDLLSALAGNQVTASVTEDGIQFSSGENDSGQTGTVTTGGGNLNVRTGAGLDNYAFTQLPNGTVVEVVGTDGDWYMIRLPERIGYVYSGYMTVSDGEAGSGDGSFSLDAETLENLLGMLGGGLNDGAALTPDGNLSLIDDIGSSTRSGKQFITVETRNGNVFYLIIDRDDEGEETVHFLNQVDEADLLTLMGDDAPAAETPAVCNCKEKCVAGAVNVSGKYKLVLATQDFFCKLHADLMGLFRRDLPRLKGLDQVTAQVRSLVDGVAAGPGKFDIRSFGGAAIGGYKQLSVRLFRVADIVNGCFQR